MTDSLCAGLAEPISLWEFCDTLGDISTKEQKQYVSFDAEEILKELREKNADIDNNVLMSLNETCSEIQSSKDACALQTRSGSEPNDQDTFVELSKYIDAMTPSDSSTSKVLTSSSSVALPPHLPLVNASNETTSAIITGGLIAQLPPIFQTKLDCPRAGGCVFNTVKSLPGGSTCKGKDAIGSKHKFSCLCGLKWQENNWRERGRLTSLGKADVRCIQYLSTQKNSKRKSRTE